MFHEGIVHSRTYIYMHVLYVWKPVIADITLSAQKPIELQDPIRKNALLIPHVSESGA